MDNKRVFLAVSLCIIVLVLWNVLFPPVQPVQQQADKAGQQAERSTQQDLPRTGMGQSSVRNGWGSPRQTTGPVGNPPISQWHYEDFVVYFEDDRVIHAVLKPQR